MSEVADKAAGEPLKVALLGCGVVGSSVARMLTTAADDLAARVGRPLELVGIAVRRAGRDRSDLPVDPSLFTTDAESLVTGPTSSSRSSAASSRPAASSSRRWSTAPPS